jgi:exonuclease III
MLRQQNPNHRQTRDVRVLQINTQRSPRVHATALQLAHENNIEVICIQEPWIGEEENRKTQTHPGFNIYAPVGDWNTRPRTMTYIKRGLGASQKMLESEEHPDLCIVTLGTSCGPIDVINVYNAGPGSERTNEAVELLMKYQSHGNALICGDFNLHHRYWDPNAARDEETAERLIDWLTDQAVILLTDPMVPTRGAGSNYGNKPANWQGRRRI